MGDAYSYIEREMELRRRYKEEHPIEYLRDRILRNQPIYQKGDRYYFFAYQGKVYLYDIEKEDIVAEQDFTKYLNEFLDSYTTIVDADSKA